MTGLVKLRSVPEEFPAYRYRSTVSRITDGDTVRVVCDLGMRISREINLRIADINAPEVFGAHGTPEGQTAKAALAALLPVGSTLYVATRKDAKSFDRYVADLYIEGDDGTLRDVGQAMIDLGQADYVGNEGGKG
jgi:endonuclease YncB( thermonuclease family)